GGPAAAGADFDARGGETEASARGAIDTEGIDGEVIADIEATVDGAIVHCNRTARTGDESAFGIDPRSAARVQRHVIAQREQRARRGNAEADAAAVLPSLRGRG